ncbi:MAG: mechanosensitive ion channel family protein [Ewingella sp.]|nr:mechanosensitive ion channel family protein [Ewingella sp.]
MLAGQLSFIVSTENRVLDVILAGARIWTLTFALLAFYSFIDVAGDLLKTNSQLRGLPYRGIEQSLKLVGALIYCLFLLSMMLDKSPLILLSGISAIAAVLLLVFKDPLLGLVAGIQLSANDMLQPGDWIEMEQLGANGVVQDIGLTTVKVLNFDNSITTLPTYTLVSGSFKNWRYMIEHSARRLQRNINIDIKTVHIITPDEKQAIIKNVTLALFTNVKTPLETNIELFQEYAKAYLRQHGSICTEMTLMVRQLQPTAYGLPVEIYAFTRLTEWTAYETLQTEIISHLISVISLFNLKVHDVS